MLDPEFLICSVFEAFFISPLIPPQQLVEEKFQPNHHRTGCRTHQNEAKFRHRGIRLTILAVPATADQPANVTALPRLIPEALGARARLN